MCEPVRILIIEDDEGMAAVIAETLQPLQERFTNSVIEIVHSWKDAKPALLRHPQPTAVCLDLRLQDMDLRYAVEEIDRIDEDCALVIISGQSKESVEKMLDGRDIEYLDKSPSLFSPNKVVNAIARAVARHALHEKNTASAERFSLIHKILEDLDSRGYGSPL